MRCAIFGAYGGPSGGASRRLYRGEENLKGLAEGFLGFVVFVVVAFVEGVGAVADYVGADAHGFAAVPASPVFGGLQEAPAGALAADFFVDDQAVDFGARRDFDERQGADVDPAHYTGGFFFGDETSGFFLAKDELEATGHFARIYWIAELCGELREAWCVGCTYFANDDRRF